MARTHELENKESHALPTEPARCSSKRRFLFPILNQIFSLVLKRSLNLPVNIYMLKLNLLMEGHIICVWTIYKQSKMVTWTICFLFQEYFSLHRVNNLVSLHYRSNCNININNPNPQILNSVTGGLNVNSGVFGNIFFTVVKQKKSLYRILKLLNKTIINFFVGTHAERMKTVSMQPWSDKWEQDSSK